MRVVGENCVCHVTTKGEGEVAESRNDGSNGLELIGFDF